MERTIIKLIPVVNIRIVFVVMKNDLGVEPGLFVTKTRDFGVPDTIKLV